MAAAKPRHGAAIEQAGGSISLIEKKVLQADEDKRAKRAAKRVKAGGPAKKKAEDE